MMTRKLVSGMLAVVALVALSAPSAQAGSGGSPSTLTGFFVCNSINGDDAGQRVDVVSSAWGFNPLNVRIGNATLACAFAKLFRPGSDHTNPANEILPNPTTTFDRLKCYSVSVAKGGTSSPPPSYSVTDGLLGTDPDVSGSSFQYICAPAGFTTNP